MKKQVVAVFLNRAARLHRIRLLTCRALAVCALGCALAEYESPAQSHSQTGLTSKDEFVIRNVRIFDGSKLIHANSVYVKNGKIHALGRHLAVPPGTVQIDARGDTLLPGLIDAHTHDWGESPKQALLFGVTTELNMAGPPTYVFPLKREELAGQHPNYAELFSAGNVVTPPKGHGTEYGFAVPTIENASQAQAFVDARIAEGSDYIKLILDDGHVCHVTFAKLSEDELSAAILAAHRRGKLTIVHISSEDDAREAISAGADGIAHIFGDRAPDPDFARFMKRRHAFATTTLTALESASGTPSGSSLATDPRLAPFLSAEARGHLTQKMPFVCSGSLQNGLLAAKQLLDAGVPVLAGTDAPAPGVWNGASLHRELELLVQAGFSPSEALKAATSVPARVFGLRDRGQIAVGLRADLLLVRNDPTKEIGATRNILAVWKAGVPDIEVPESGLASSPPAK